MCCIINDYFICPAEEATPVCRGDVQSTFLGRCALLFIIGVLFRGDKKRCLDLSDERKLTCLIHERIVSDFEIDFYVFLGDGSILEHGFFTYKVD